MDKYEAQVAHSGIHGLLKNSTREENSVLAEEKQQVEKAGMLEDSQPLTLSCTGMAEGFSGRQMLANMKDSLAGTCWPIARELTLVYLLLTEVYFCPYASSCTVAVNLRLPCPRRLIASTAVLASSWNDCQQSLGE